MACSCYYSNIFSYLGHNKKSVVVVDAAIVVLVSGWEPVDAGYPQALA
jgi:hypothetical protein